MEWYLQARNRDDLLVEAIRTIESVKELVAEPYRLTNGQMDVDTLMRWSSKPHPDSWPKLRNDLMDGLLMMNGRIKALEARVRELKELISTGSGRAGETLS